MKATILIVATIALVSGVCACLLQKPISKLKYFVHIQLSVYRKLQSIKRGDMPDFTGLSLTKNQIIKIKEMLPNTERHNTYYERYIKCRYIGELSELP